jgi:hypothetical protein
MTNVLEAIVLPVTSSEIDNGSFERLIHQFQKLDQTDLVFVIMINNMSHKTNIKPLLKTIERKFKTLEVCYLNIPPEDDVYVTENYPKMISNIPELGYASGPNLMFLASMDYCKRFNTTLLIEVDCFFKKSFIHDLEMFTRYSGGFLIAGTTYDGVSNRDPLTADFHHLNGVALYKTGDHIFQHVITELEKYIIEYVQTEEPYIAYDIAIVRMIFRNISKERGDNWKRVFKRCMKTNLIVNLSPRFDANIPDLLSKFPEAVIIHKKFIDTDMHSLQGFLIQDSVQ